MRVKTAELSGPALRFVVGKLEGHLEMARCPWMLEKHGFAAWQSYERNWGYPLPKYDTDWARGGPIGEREHIAASYVNGQWAAFHPDREHGGVLYKDYFGPTELIAKMRCYVASRLGDEVEVPDEVGVTNAHNSTC